MPSADEKHGRSFGFGLSAIRRFPEIAPVVLITGVAVVGAGSYIMYCLTKSDVVLDRSKETPPWDRVDFEKKQKLMVVKQEYKKNPELEQLKKEMGDFK